MISDEYCWFNQRLRQSRANIKTSIMRICFMGPVPLVSIYILGLQCAEIESKKSGLLAYLEEVGFNILTPMWSNKANS